VKRECGACTKCCDGWLSAKLYDFEIGNHIGCPLRIIGKGCSVYENPSRPHICNEFRCGWLRDDGTLFEEWMKPDIVNFILVFYKVEELHWYKLVRAGEDINTLMLSYVIQKALRQNINLEYWINNTQFLIGSEEFKKYVKC